MVSRAANGAFVGTFTARHGANADVTNPQPAIWTLGPIEQQRGRQEFPMLYDGHNRMRASGRHIGEDAHVIVDGRRVPGRVTLHDDEEVVIELSSLPSVGMHLLQIQNRNGRFSNDFIFHVTEDAEAAAELKRRIDQAHVDTRVALATAVARGDREETRKLLAGGARIDARQPTGGSTPLSDAALHGHVEIVKFLIGRGANVAATNRDGNTPLHVAAFLCRSEIVQLLLDKDASALQKNDRGETAIDVVSSPWSEQLAAFYTGIGNAVGLELDLERIEWERPRIAALLRESAEKSKQDE